MEGAIGWWDGIQDTRRGQGRWEGTVCGCWADRGKLPGISREFSVIWGYIWGGVADGRERSERPLSVSVHITYGTGGTGKYNPLCRGWIRSTLTWGSYKRTRSPMGFTCERWRATACLQPTRRVGTVRGGYLLHGRPPISRSRRYSSMGWTWWVARCRQEGGVASFLGITWHTTTQLLLNALSWISTRYWARLKIVAQSGKYFGTHLKGYCGVA